jgi:hypothetical protein
MPSIIDDTKIVITKLEAGRRQLRTAIRFWFEDGDPVAIHTLVAATYEILDTLAKRRGVVDLLFDTDIIKDEYRKKWIKLLKSSANFFKHADRDADDSIEFSLLDTEMFMIFSCVASEKMGETLGTEEAAIMTYFILSSPEVIDEDVRKKFSLLFEQLKSTSKRDFLNQFSSSWRGPTFTFLR